MTAKTIALYALICASYGVAAPRVSIITSLYKGDTFIKGFLKDITAQTIFKDCELIIINANSPGNEEAVIKPYLKRYKNIVYYRLAQDPGLYGVWNIALKKAKAPYVTNANVDDRLAVNALEVKARALDKHQDVDLVYSDIYITYTPNLSFDDGPFDDTLRFPQFSKEKMNRCLPNNAPMWRKSMHAKYGYFDRSYKAAGDYEMWLRAVRGGAQFLKISGIFGLYYVNPQGLSTNAHDTVRFIERDRICAQYPEFFNKEKLMPFGNYWLF